MSAGKLVLIIGPSGVGKSVILKELRSRHPEFVFPRSATTRPRRPGEGDDLYHFVSESEFEQWIKEGKFLEWATVHGNLPGTDGSVRAGAHYGTLKDEILPAIEQGKTVVREVDVQGFQAIRKNDLFEGASPKYTLQSIFILPESKEQLISHITKRAPIGTDELKRRIASMERELTFAELCTAQVKNEEGRLDETLKKVEELIG